MIMHGDRPVDTIFIHCSATRPEWLGGSPLADKVAEITRWHKVKGWETIGYHWIIDRDGSVAAGRPESKVGAHVVNYNKGSIGICLIGGHGSSENGEFLKSFTPAQDEALRKLIKEIEGRTDIKRIRGHNEVAAKACPGFNVTRWLNNEQAKPYVSHSTTVQASAVQLLSGAGGAAGALGVLDGKAQIVALILFAIIIAAAAWVMRERIERWVKDMGE